MNVKATFEGVDFWSRPLIRTEGGTLLCDTECHDPEVIQKFPNLGHWHTLTPAGEPIGYIRGDITITLIPKEEKADETDA